MLALSLSIVACSKDAVEEIVPPEEETPNENQGGNENPSDSTGIDVPGKDTTEFKYIKDYEYAEKFNNWRKIHVNINDLNKRGEEVMLFSSRNPKKDFYAEIQGKTWKTAGDIIVKKPILHAKTPVSVDMWIPKDMDSVYFIDNSAYCIKGKDVIDINYESASIYTQFRLFKKGGCEIYKKNSGHLACFSRKTKKITMKIQYSGSVREPDKENPLMVGDWLKYQLKPALNGYMLNLKTSNKCTFLIPKSDNGFYGSDSTVYMDFPSFKEYVKAGNIKEPELNEFPNSYDFFQLDAPRWNISEDTYFSFILIDCKSKEVYDLRDRKYEKSYAVIKRGNGVYDIRFELDVPLGEVGEPDQYDSYTELRFRVTIKEEQGTSNQVVSWGIPDPTKYEMIKDDEEYTYRVGAYFMEDKPQDDMDFNDMVGIYSETDYFKSPYRDNEVKEIIRTEDPDIIKQVSLWWSDTLNRYIPHYNRKIYMPKPDNWIGDYLGQKWPGYYRQSVSVRIVNTEEYPFVIDIPLPAFYDDNDSKIGYAPDGKKISDVYDFMGSSDWYKKVKGGAILLDNPDFRNDRMFDFPIPEK